MDTELLKTFLEVRKTRHFGKAAVNLHLTQAAVSARVRQLEQLLGVKLFTRGRNNIQLTSEGERLVGHAETVLLTWSRARQELALQAGQSSQIRIGIRAGLWSMTLQNRLQLLHKKMPELALHTQAHMPDATIRMLLDRSLDISLSYDPPNLPEFRLPEIGQLDLHLFSSSKGTSTESALAAGYVYIDWGNAFARFHSKSFGEVVLPILSSNLVESALRFIQENGGAAYLPKTLVADAKPALYAVEGAPHYTRKLHAVYRTASDPSALIESVLDVFEGLNI